MADSDYAVKIDLTEKRIRVLEPAASLLFEGESSHFYLYSIAIVAHEMKQLTSSGDAMPFVPFSKISDRLRRVADAIQVRFKSEESMAETLYHTWHKRLHASGPGSKFRVSRKLMGQEEIDIGTYFETQIGKAGLRAGYRIQAVPDDIFILKDKLFEQMLGSSDQGSEGVDEVMQRPPLPSHNGLIIDIGEVTQPEESGLGALVRFSLTGASVQPIKVTSLTLVVESTAPSENPLQLVTKALLMEVSLVARLKPNTTRYSLTSRHCLLKHGETDGFVLRVDGQDGVAYTVHIVARWHELGITDECESVSGPLVLRFPTRAALTKPWRAD